jgi:hypothetical protein
VFILQLFLKLHHQGLPKYQDNCCKHDTDLQLMEMLRLLPTMHREAKQFIYSNKRENYRQIYICFCYLFTYATTLSVVQTTYTVERYDKWTVKDEEGSGGDLTCGNILAFSWMDWGKPQKALIRIAGLQAKFWTPDIPNMKQECCCPHECDIAYVTVKESS